MLDLELNHLSEVVISRRKLERSHLLENELNTAKYP